MSKKFIVATIVIASILCAIIIAFPDNKEIHDEVQTTIINASDEIKRKEYFASHGWDVEEISEKDILIPSNFSDAYEKYALIQDKQGLPLRNYVGREAKIYTYKILNYNSDMLAELIVCDGNAIASVVYGNDIEIPVN